MKARKTELAKIRTDLLGAGVEGILSKETTRGHVCDLFLAKSVLRWQ